MLKIDRLILRLPPEFTGREKSLGTALAHALGETPAYDRRQTIASITASMPAMPATQSDAAIARQIAAHVQTRIAAGQKGSRP